MHVSPLSEDWGGGISLPLQYTLQKVGEAVFLLLASLTEKNSYSPFFQGLRSLSDGAIILRYFRSKRKGVGTKS